VKWRAALGFGFVVGLQPGLEFVREALGRERVRVGIPDAIVIEIIPVGEQVMHRPVAAKLDVKTARGPDVIQRAKDRSGHAPIGRTIALSFPAIQQFEIHAHNEVCEAVASRVREASRLRCRTDLCHDALEPVGQAPQPHSERAGREARATLGPLFALVGLTEKWLSAASITLRNRCQALRAAGNLSFAYHYS
jgi:hypothetical protein